MEPQARPRILVFPGVRREEDAQAPRPGTYRCRMERPGTLRTGVARLDALLGGGYPAGSAVLLYGPPFCGKQQLQQRSVCEGARQGIPVVYILHSISAAAMSQRLRAMDPDFALAEADGLVTYLDAYSRFLGEPTDHPNATYVDDPMDLGKLLARFDQATAQAGPTLVAIESLSTLLVDVGASRTFAFLRTVLGRTIHRGGVALMAMESSMHTEGEVQMAKHLCTGMLELQKKGEGYFLHIEGLETAYLRPGWVEYQFSPTQFKLTGSFAARTIR